MRELKCLECNEPRLKCVDLWSSCPHTETLRLYLICAEMDEKMYWKSEEQKLFFLLTLKPRAAIQGQLCRSAGLPPTIFPWTVLVLPQTPNGGMVLRLVPSSSASLMIRKKWGLVFNSERRKILESLQIYLHFRSSRCCSWSRNRRSWLSWSRSKRWTAHVRKVPREPADWPPLNQSYYSLMNSFRNCVYLRNVLTGRDTGLLVNNCNRVRHWSK